MKNFSVILLFFTLGASAQNVAPRLDSFFTGLAARRQFNGSVSVAQNGAVSYKRSFGYADFRNNIPNGDSSQFSLASVSKVFTATAVLQLRDRGKLKLDDPFAKYFPAFPHPGITIRHLLSHTSGLPDYELYEEAIDANPDKIFTNADVLPVLAAWKEPLYFKPGERWEYSNTNFCLLALLTEKLSGMPFTRYVEKYIFAPAGMAHTRFDVNAPPARQGNRVVNHEYPWLFSAEMQNVDDMKKYRWRLYNLSGFAGQGNITTTTADMLRFDRALYSGKLLKPATLEEAFTPTKLNDGQNADADIGIGQASYGLGWFMFTDTSGGRTVWHTGGVPGSLSVFMRNTTRKQTLILFDNAFNTGVYRDAVNAMAILNGKPVHPRPKSPVRDYAQTLVAKGPDAAYCRLVELRGDTVHYHLSEDDLNDLGLQLLYAATFEGHNELALEVLKLNTLLFPAGFNTYDSYGEALAKLGRKEEAITMYKKSLQLNPGNEGGRKALVELVGE